MNFSVQNSSEYYQRNTNPYYNCYLDYDMAKATESFVYILECKDGSLYTGYTTDVQRRMNEHQQGVGSKYVRSRGFHRLLYLERQKTRSSAMIRERQIKTFSPVKKYQLQYSNQNILSDIDELIDVCKNLTSIDT